MITQAGYTKIVDNLNMSIKEGRYFLGAKMHVTPIHRTERSLNSVTCCLYLGDDVAGKLTRLQLVDTDGNVFADQEVEIQKAAKQSLVVAFTFTLKK